MEELGPHELKGVAEPMMLYTVVGPREPEQDDHGDMLSGGFDALVGRDEEIGLLLRRWEQSKEGQGQVVLISGEAGLGKSSLVEGLRAHVRQEGYTRIAFRCSPYTVNSAFHPVIEHVQQVLGWQREDSDETRLAKLAQGLAGYQLPSEESVPLLANLLSFALPKERYPALTLTPQQQRQQTHDVLVAWMLEEAERQPLLAVWEDLHWADPSTLELLGLFIDQAATVPMMNVLVFRPEFEPPWSTQSPTTPLSLNRLERAHIEVLVTRLAEGKNLPPEVMAHIVAKTDGVPLYVEELTKMLLESEFLQEEIDTYVLRGSLSNASIPATLQDSLMARLDRLPEAREVVQLGAVLGREFAYEMLLELAAVEELALQESLTHLVDQELFYQRGRMPRAKFIFRHALMRDTAYQSLLRRRRQQQHRLVAQLLEARFPDVVERQPELVAHHFTEAGLVEPAIVYWQRAGQRASDRSANQEAISHLTNGLSLLGSLPETLDRHHQELPLQIALGAAYLMVRGQGAAEVEVAYTRARVLCRELGDAQDVFPVLLGLWRFYNTRPDLPMARQLGEELLGLAERRDEAPLYVMAHYALGFTCYLLGELLPARHHLEAGVAHYTPTQRTSPMFRAGQDPGVACHIYTALTLRVLGYPDQSLVCAHDALALATEVDHPFTSAFAHFFASMVYQFRGEGQQVYDHAEAAISLSIDQGFPFWLAIGTVLRGWALMTLGEVEEGVSQMRQGLTEWRRSGVELAIPYLLTLIAEGYKNLEQVKAGLDVLVEGIEIMARTGEHLWKAEVCRLQGDLLLHQATPDAAQAGSCFHQALDVSRHQQAKSLELRAATSLAQLWQTQGKKTEAYDLLAPVYEWFTEGFDTPDLIGAKQLIDELSDAVK